MAFASREKDFGRESTSGWGLAAGFGVAATILGGAYILYRFFKDQQEGNNSQEEREPAAMENRGRRPGLETDMERENSRVLQFVASSDHSPDEEMHHANPRCRISEMARKYHMKIMHRVRRELSNENVVETLNRHSSHMRESEKRMKRQEMMVTSFAKIAVLAYVECIVVGTLRMQMNFLGALLYGNHIPSIIQKSYLQLVDDFFGRPLKEVMDYVRSKTAASLRNGSLDDVMTGREVQHTLLQLHSSISSDAKSPLDNLKAYILPEHTQARLRNEFPDNCYMNLLVKGLADLMSNPYAISTMKSSVGEVMIFIAEQIMGPYPGNSLSRAQPERMKKLVLRIDRMIEHPGRHGFAELLLEKTLEEHNLKTLSDNLYDGRI